MDTSSLSSKQIWLAQEFSWYYFWVDYREGKANAAADVLSCFSQRSQSEEEELWAKNTQILYQLQSSLTNASLSGLNLSDHSIGSQVENLSPLHQVLICGTYVLPPLCQFWEELYGGLVSKESY